MTMMDYHQSNRDSTYTIEVFNRHRVVTTIWCCSAKHPRRRSAADAPHWLRTSPRQYPCSGATTPEAPTCVVDSCY